MFDEVIQFITEELMHLAQSAFLGEGRVFEIIRLDAKVGSDVVADHFEPTDLFLGEWLFAAGRRSY
ncbi:hypothetical protein SCT_1181 [Sulfuricella sp. T08]|nr:hypothetical protein SCT_1181 [Sulfuricella sp. T08]